MAQEFLRHPSHQFYDMLHTEHVEGLSQDPYDKHASNNKLNTFGSYVQAEDMQQQQQADLSSPFSCSQQGFKTNFKTNYKTKLPLGVKDKKLLCDTGSYEQHTHCQHSDLPAASLERYHFQGFNTSGSENKIQKKVGRPIAYKGDPNSAHLIEAERRRIIRRIANRESAGRVRGHRQETLEELQIRVTRIA